MNIGKEAGKLGAFALIAAAMAWIAKKSEGSWFGTIFFKQSETSQPKKEVK